jgi:two-component system response regulator VicR
MGPDSPPKTVLVVDDDPGIRRLMKGFFKVEGFLAVTATNGLEALKYLQEGGVADVILLDLRMPLMDGWTFRRELLANPALAHIPVIVLSGANADRTPELQAAAWFDKPVTVKQVVVEVRRLCEGR